MKGDGKHSQGELFGQEHLGSSHELLPIASKVCAHKLLGSGRGNLAPTDKFQQPYLPVFVKYFHWSRALPILVATGMSSFAIAQPSLALAEASFASPAVSAKVSGCGARQGDGRFDNFQRECQLHEEQQQGEEKHAQKWEVAQRRQDDQSQLLEVQSLYDQGKFASAEPILRKLIKKEPENVVMHYQLGNVLYRQDKLEEAITEYQQVVKLDSKYAVAYNAVGVIRARLGDLEQALTEFKHALSINPDYGEALQNLGRALWQQGKGSEAIAPLEKAKSIFKQQLRFEDVRQIDQLLQEINKKKIEA